MGHVQQGRGEFGLGGTRTTWQKANLTELLFLVVEKVYRQEEATVKHELQDSRVHPDVPEKGSGLDAVSGIHSHIKK